MERFLKRHSDVSNLVQCIIKEELIIPDEEIKVEKVEDEIDVVNVDDNFSGFQAEINVDDEHNKSNETKTKRKRERPKTKINNKKKVKLDLSKKSKNVGNKDEQINNSNNPEEGEEPITGATAEQDIHDYAKKVAKAFCKMCKNESEVVLFKRRCDKCNIPFSYTCNTCDKTYSSFPNLSFHLKTKHIEAHLSYLCSICNHTYSNKKMLMLHRRTDHNVYESRMCSKCGKQFARSVNKLMHEKFCRNAAIGKCGEAILYKCDKCPYTTRESKVLKIHDLEKHTEGFKAECKNCPKVFTNICSFKRHARIYCNKTKTLECDFCGYKVFRKDQLAVHIDQYHMIGYYTNSNTIDELKRTRVCEHCGEALTRAEEIKHHMLRCQTGLQSPLYKRESRVCKYCGENLNRGEKMWFHVQRCESAPLTLRFSAERAKLPDIDTALNELALSYCSKCQIKEPLKHRIPRCEKCKKLLKYICVSCSKTFVDKYILRVHLKRVHVRNLKFYRCNECRFSYKRKWNLMEHIRDCHTEKTTITKYNCDKCNKEYKSVESLRNHKVICGQEPKFQCDKCPYKSHFKYSVAKHIWATRSNCI